MPNVGNRTVQAKETVGGTTFKNFVNVQAFNNGWKNVKKMFVYNGSAWIEVWNNRPVTVTGAVSSSAYDRLTATGTVDPNNFDSTPRFFYKKSSDSSYIQDVDLTTVSGDGAQSVGNRTITGLTENTTYNVYLSATNAAGTSDVPSVVSVTTPYDCRLDANGVPLGTGWNSINLAAVYSGTCGNITYQIPTQYTKTGCPNSPSIVNGPTIASPNCGGAGCYGTPTVTQEYYDGSCSTRRFRTKTVTNPVAGSSCSSTTSYSAPYDAPTCEGACTVAKTGDFIQDGNYYSYEGTPGYYSTFSPRCDPNFGCFGADSYYVQTCGSTNFFTLLYAQPCYNAFGDPC